MVLISKRRGMEGMSAHLGEQAVPRQRGYGHRPRCRTIGPWIHNLDLGQALLQGACRVPRNLCARLPAQAIRARYSVPSVPSSSFEE